MSDHKKWRSEVQIRNYKEVKNDLTRRADESVKIDIIKKSELLNSKNEFNHHLSQILLLKKETIMQAHTQFVQDMKQNSGPADSI